MSPPTQDKGKPTTNVRRKQVNNPKHTNKKICRRTPSSPRFIQQRLHASAQIHPNQVILISSQPNPGKHKETINSNKTPTGQPNLALGAPIKLFISVSQSVRQAAISFLCHTHPPLLTHLVVSIIDAHGPVRGQVIVALVGQVDCSPKTVGLLGGVRNEGVNLHRLGCQLIHQLHALARRVHRCGVGCGVRR